MSSGPGGIADDPLLAVAIRAARRAAAVLEDAARDLKRLPAHARSRAELASAADVDAENAVIATLRSAFPDHAVVGEESGELMGGATAARPGSCKWFVDPVDGSVNFAHGYPYYAISLALAQGARITHAIVLDPVREELFAAIAGRGATLNGSPLHVSACTALEEALVGTVFPMRDSPKLPGYLAVFNRVLPRCRGVRRAGACALDLCFVAAGRLDGFFVLGAKSWDVAAGALIVEEAGGRIGDLAGGGDFLRTNELIAASPGVFAALRDAVAASRI
jgi:myo-inositol-1(or 4)-monophosphatase